MESFGDSVIKVLFPARCDQSAKSLEELGEHFSNLRTQLKVILRCLEDELNSEIHSEDIIDGFFTSLPEIERRMSSDAKFILDEDPAARSLNEVIICYPGFYAVGIYRIAHYFLKKEVSLFPRILTEYAHQKTGIDIHPGAQIDFPFFIDHGTGVVVGETTVIGKNVKVYQGVTLGATTVAKDLVGQKRHPTICDNVVIYSNATILGGDTIVGKNSVIGGNVWLVKSVTEYSKIFYDSKGESSDSP